MKNRHALALTHIGVAIAAFAVASCMGVLQAMSVADVDFPQRTEPLYYESVTAHGVLMALVFTTFFIMGLGYVFAEENLGRIVGRGAAWFAFWLGAAGSVAAAVTIVLGQSTVLYTFYPPLQAHPLFYIGATLLVIASWIWGARLHRELSVVAARAPRCAGAARHSRHARHNRHLVSGNDRPRDRSGRHAHSMVAGLGRRRSIRCWRARSSGGSGTRSCTSGCCRPTCSGTRCCRAWRAAGCSATAWRGWCSSCSCCSRRRSDSTINSRIRGSAPAGSSRTR